MGEGTARAEGSEAEAARSLDASPEALVLLVGCPAELVAACREAGERADVTVRTCDPSALPAAASVAPSFTLVVMEDLYRRDPAAFDSLTRQGALLRLEADDVRRHGTPRVLAEAILGAVSSFESSVRSSIV